MIEIFKDILLNIFFIMLPIAFYQLIFKEKRSMYRNILTYFLFVIPIVLCMHFRINLVQNGFIYDMKMIPFILAAYYGGPISTILLYFTLISYRLLFGGIGVYNNFVAASTGLIIFSLTFKKFQTLNLTNKMIFTAIVSWIIKTTGFITYIALSGHFDAHAFLVSELFFIWHCIVILMFVFLLEYIKKNALLVEEVMKTEKMRIVSDIAAAVAHEVRNPLTAVRGFLQLLQQEDLSSESRKKYATISLDELHRAQNIISDYLSLAKPEAEEVEHINVNEEIEYVVKVLSSYANINDVVVESNISNTIELTGNRARFKQCLINICKNAIEAMPQGGLLTIQAEIHNNQASITISDTGDGMKKHQIERLGMPYYSTKEEGTGLGTMVAFSIVRQMGGKISAISEEGKGTSFILRFPFEKSGSGELR